jgi:hypothetical protein
MEDSLAYKIRCKSDGTFSSGGQWPIFTSKGKIWSGIGPLKNHLRLVRKGIYDDCEILVIKINMQYIDIIPMSDFYG